MSIDISALISTGAAVVSGIFAFISWRQNKKQSSQIDLFLSDRRVSFRNKSHSYIQLTIINSGLLPIVACEIKFSIIHACKNVHSIGIYNVVLAPYGINKVVLPKKIDAGEIYKIDLFNSKTLLKIDKLWLTDNYDRKWDVSLDKINTLKTQLKSKKFKTAS